MPTQKNIEARAGGRLPTTSIWSWIQLCLCVCMLSHFSSVQFICSVVSDSLRPHESQHVRPSCPSHSRSPPKPMSIKSVMPSNHLILCCPLLLPPFPASGSFPMSKLFASDGQSIGASASSSVLSMKNYILISITNLSQTR